MSRVSLSVSDAEVDLAGGNLVLVIIVAAIALVALGMAVLFRSQVLAAGEGTEQMRTIAKAVQEGASAYLTRQFRTLAIFAGIAFFLLMALPADDFAVRIGRSVFFLVGAAFLALAAVVGGTMVRISKEEAEAALHEAQAVG